MDTETLHFVDILGPAYIVNIKEKFNYNFETCNNLLFYITQVWKFYPVNMLYDLYLSYKMNKYRHFISFITYMLDTFH